MFSPVRRRAKKAGQPPGTAMYTGTKKDKAPVITVIQYSSHDFHEYVGPNLKNFTSAEKNEVSGPIITWINVEGLHDVPVVEELAKRFGLHPLTVEDILNVEQRPKIEEFDLYTFITIKVLLWYEKKSTFSIKQLSIVLGENFVLSFQEQDTTLFDQIRLRLSGDPSQRLRQQGSDYLTYRLMDAVVDNYFIVLEGLGDQIEKMEERIVSSPTQQNVRTVYRLKRQMLLLRRNIWPMREAVSHLMHSDSKLISKFTELYLRDLYDHTVQAIDSIEIFRDILSNMIDMYLTSLTNRMNEIMKTLTIITTIFIPITSIASIYGMNFEYMPELKSRYGYPVVLLVMLTLATSMLIYFRRKKWI
jgi:magnesium transporter